MPIKPEHRHFHPIDWPQMSDAIRFDRTKGAIGIAPHEGCHRVIAEQGIQKYR